MNTIIQRMYGIIARNDTRGTVEGKYGYNRKTDTYGERGIEHRHGRNGSVGTAWVTVDGTGTLYSAPSGTFQIEILSASADDTASGTRAREVKIVGLGAAWQLQSDILPMNGVTPVPSNKQWRRIFRINVNETGTYGLSNGGQITCRTVGGGQVHARIQSDNVGLGESMVGRFTVPKGYTALIKRIEISVDTNKSASIALMQRQSANVTGTGMQAPRVIHYWDGVSAQIVVVLESTIHLPEYTDMYFIAKAPMSTSGVSVDWDMELVR